MIVFDNADVSLDGLRQILNLTGEQARNAGFSPQFCQKVELAIEEVIVNIIKHGYPDSKGPISITFEMKDSLEIVIKDKGMPFNPLTAVQSSDGCGWRLVHSIASHVGYRFEGKYNVLTLRFKEKAL